MNKDDKSNISKSLTQYEKPPVSVEYNDSMGFVDRLDQNINLKYLSIPLPPLTVVIDEFGVLLVIFSILWYKIHMYYTKILVSKSGTQFK